MFVRGKNKFVYDCELSVQVKGINDFEEVTGEVKIKEINNHTLDDDFEVKLNLKVYNLVRLYREIQRRFY